jgi:hypothetical protein
MLRFYNAFERTHRYADKVKPTLSVLYHGIKSGWIGGKELVHLLVFLKFLKRRWLPFRAIFDAVLADSANRQMEPQHIVAVLGEEKWRGVVAERMNRDPAFVRQIQQAIEGLSREERALVAENETIEMELEDPDLPTEEPAATLGLFRASREIRAARERLGERGITHVVFGHTHEVVNGALDGSLFNPGTWLSHLNLREAYVKEKIRRQGLTYRDDGEFRRIVRVT